MKKTLVLAVFMLTLALASTLMVNFAKAESIESRTSWIDYAFKGTDDFYDKDVVAYRAGSQAILAVEVKNTNPGPYIDVTVVGVSFDWQKPAAGWYNSTQASKTAPVRLESGETQYFIVNFTVPSLTTAYSVVHDYTVYVEFVDSGGASQKWTATRGSLFGAEKQYFVVFSDDQALAAQSAQTIDGIKASLGTPVTWSSKAGLLWKRAMNETSIADYYYNLGDFANAKTHYSAALSLIDQAFEAEESRGVRLEDAEIKSAEAEAKYFDSLGNFYSGLSNMWTLFGVALVLFAIGYIIRGFPALRKPAVPP